jgi:hypothetical protein
MAWQELGGANTGQPNNAINANIHWLGTRNAAPLIIRTENGPLGAGNAPNPAAEAMRITAAADGRRVGIGTTIPQAKLDVNGAIRAFGNFAVEATSPSGPSFFGFTTQGNGILGISGSLSTLNDAGVSGEGLQRNGIGVEGVAETGSVALGVWGRSREGYAGYFTGNVRVTGQLQKPGGGFEIDCPGKETDCYLYHSFVESSDMKNVYDGIVRLDEDGSAWIELPEWFGGLNRDCRYQLTAIGGPAPDLHIAEEISENRFRIAGGTAGMNVSWQVTGIRKDPWAERNRIVVEEDKPEGVRGTYLHPEAFGQPETLGEDYARVAEARSRSAEARSRSADIRGGGTASRG